MSTVDASAVEMIDRYRAALDAAQGGGEEQLAMSYEEVAARLFLQLTSMGRLAWAVAHPLQPIAADVLVDAHGVGGDELEDLLLELNRFGTAILVRGDPAELAELGRRGERERLEQELLAESMKQGARDEGIAIARRWSKILETRLRMIEPDQRATVLTELAAAFDSDD